MYDRARAVSWRIICVVEAGIDDIGIRSERILRMMGLHDMAQSALDLC